MLHVQEVQDNHKNSNNANEPSHADQSFGTDQIPVEAVVVNGSALEGTVKLTTDDKANGEPVLEPLRGGSTSTTTDVDRAHTSDAASVRSLPVVQVTEPQTPARRSLAIEYDGRRFGTPFSESTSASATSSRTNIVQTNGSNLTPNERRHRHRSAVEFRSPNRFSDFFTSLIHRRESTPSPSTQNLMHNESTSDSSCLPETSRTESPPSRPVTPPPPLPPPTLQELGLSLSVVTSDLSPSHFSAAPSSGAFLAPHFLLLCHAQGLDVLPITSPPAPQPYALVRRVSFKSVVVMEQRGVLVAIAGRRDGVRVYALDEVKKAVQWRMEVEIQRERERMRREGPKKVTPSPSIKASQELPEKKPMARSLTPPSARGKHTRRLSFGPSTPSRTPSSRRPSTSTSHHMPAPSPLITPRTSISTETSGLPPPYSASGSPTTLRTRASTISISRVQSRPESVVDVLAGRRNAEAERDRNSDEKAEWRESRDSSEDEALNVVAAAASGSQALDERTSAQHSSHAPTRGGVAPETIPRQMSTTSNGRRSHGADFDLGQATVDTASAEPSPAPTLRTFRQALAQQSASSPSTQHEQASLIDVDDIDKEEPTLSRGERITLAQALQESRLPDLPPVGTRRPQQPILITSSHPVETGQDDDMDDIPNSGLSLAEMLMESRLPNLPPAGTCRPQQPIMIESVPRDLESADSNYNSVASRTQPNDRGSRRSKARRWTAVPALFANNASHASTTLSPSASLTAGSMAGTSTPASSTARSTSRLGVSFFGRTTSPSDASPASHDRRALHRGMDPAASGNLEEVPEVVPLPSASALPTLGTHSRFLPRIISNALQTRRSDDHAQALAHAFENENFSQKFLQPMATQAPPPKLEYVKLPGTKNALSIKAVETARKSFLAILCGDNGEKVELFAGTYRTALGLSRTFILPDSPRSLELQLQGDDLVELFLMFPQNVFGLEPATVRVREVRIGRAERRAARRRARELRSEETNAMDSDPNALDDDANVNVTIGLAVTSQSSPNDAQALVPAISPEGPATHAQTSSNTTSVAAHAQSEDMTALAAAQMGPYTTFQQLDFAPNFPLASIADEYVIPPTYPDFLLHRSKHEATIPLPPGSSDQLQAQFTPPGLPVPAPASPSRWFYRDPKGIVHGPWKAALMQAWYKDGLLPLDLPLRREEETEYILLRDLRAQSVDPTHPFRSQPSPPAVESQASEASSDASRGHDISAPLLPPMSLLAQPRHFGPPALFFSSRGGHSTAIVDARGRSVLKGRFEWSADDDESKSASGRMGDVKRLEAFDVKDRSVLVAMRQGGLEAIDLGDALLKPADESRTILPHFTATPMNMSRRSPFVWKIGTPVSASPTSSTVLSSRQKGTHLTLPYKKQGASNARSLSKSSEPANGDLDSVYHDEVLFLGRKDDEIYICERNAGAFRILRLSSHPS